MKFYKRVAIATLLVLQVIGAHAIDGYDLWLRMPMVTNGAKVTIDNPQIPETGNFDPQFAPIAISRSELNTFLHNTGRDVHLAIDAKAPADDGFQQNREGDNAGGGPCPLDGGPGRRV